MKISRHHHNKNNTAANEKDGKTPELSFTCDEMLKGLARWLRVAGYDTHICLPGTTDRELIEQAASEHRWLLTRDRKLTEYRSADNTVILLKGNNTDECALELASHIPIDWQFRPFTRCVTCNTPLVVADGDMIERVPNDSRKLARPLLYCNQCDKVYWAGSHTERMRKKLLEFTARR